MDKFDPKSWTVDGLSDSMRPEDNWLLSRTENLKAEVENEAEEFEIHKACRAIEDFILNDLSRWYVKLIRNRTWVEGETKKKYGAYKALHESLLTLAKLMAPITPHISESMYQSLDGELLSVHMCHWPETDESRLDVKLEERMKVIQDMVELASKASIPRWRRR